MVFMLNGSLLLSTILPFTNQLLTYFFVLLQSPLVFIALWIKFSSTLAVTAHLVTIKLNWAVNDGAGHSPAKVSKQLKGERMG